MDYETAFKIGQGVAVLLFLSMLINLGRITRRLTRQPSPADLAARLRADAALEESKNARAAATAETAALRETIERLGLLVNELTQVNSLLATTETTTGRYPVALADLRMPTGPGEPWTWLIPNCPYCDRPHIRAADAGTFVQPGHLYISECGHGLHTIRSRAQDNQPTIDQGETQ